MDRVEFQRDYHEILKKEVLKAGIPHELTERFFVDSCVKEGRVYFVARKSDEVRGVLRVTATEGGENAAKEAAILSRLDHPAIPKVLYSTEHNGRAFLVREHFKGDDLNKYIFKRGTLYREHLLDIILQLCDLLSYLHKQSPAVIHRDIKPENIIVYGKNNVKLIDFGISRKFREKASESERDTYVAGTEFYISPEQRGNEQTDNRADIYSLGITMIFMATGKTDKENLRKSYPYKELIPVIKKCIQRDRERRFKTAAHLKRRLKWIRNRMTLKILLSVSAGIIIAGTFFFGLNTGHDEVGYERGLEDGFQNGIDFIMDAPARKNEIFSEEELYEPITFDSWYLDMAVRNILGVAQDYVIYRTLLVSRVRELSVYGRSIVHPDQNENGLVKEHIGRGAVNYHADNAWFVGDRGDIASLDEIPNMYYMFRIELSSQSIADLTPLTGMKLETIVLADNYIGNLVPLKDMVTLRKLDVCQNPLRDLTPISRLLSLEYLDISQTQVTDLSPIVELTKLETLSLVYTDVSDIGVLSSLTNLREVDVSHTSVTDLTPLIRAGEPITVRCAGLPDAVIDMVRGVDGIVLVEG
ncbi:MAG: serine/threonine protein kinase [Oscillospiraceae bacterium]|nr:serine/threonine protein kinase [Oscillospiraceae bacterium]